MLANLYLQKKTTIQHILEREAEKFMREIETNDFRIDSEQRTSKMIVPLESNLTLSQALRTRLKHFQEDSYSIKNTRTLQDKILQDTLVIDGPMNLEDCIAIAKNIHEDESARLYGIMLINLADKNDRINPLHPLVALELAKKNDTTLYKMVIYTMPDEYTELHMYSDSERIDENILTQMALYEQKQDIGIVQQSDGNIDSKLENFKRGSELSRSTVNRISIGGTDNINQDEIDILVPCQLLVDGLSMPYYGTSLIKYTKSTQSVRGAHVSPMNSCNVGAGESSNIHSDTIIMSTSVCTGNNQKASIEGWRGMSAANLKSPYHEYMLHKGWFTYVQKCIDASLDVYNTLFDFVEPVIELTFKQQWLESNPEMSDMDYIQFLADRIERVDVTVAPTNIPGDNIQILDMVTVEPTAVPSIDDVTSQQ